MGARAGEPAGIIYGDVAAVEFQFAASAPSIKRLDYVSAEHPGGIALGQVVQVRRRSRLSFDDAVSLGTNASPTESDPVSCLVRVLGYRDERGLLQVPRTPFRSGTEVRFATPTLIQKVLGLTVDRRDGAFIGHLRNTDIPVVLDVNTLVQKHVSILAKTGAGKSYTVGVVLEELLLHNVPVVIIDPHGEYSTLGNPNIEDHDLDNMRRFGIKPKGFHKKLTEYVLEDEGRRRQRLRLTGEGLEARELVEMVPSKLSSAQVGLLYQAVNELKKSKQHYTLSDLVTEISKSPSNAKWAVVGALESLEATGLFADEGTPLDQLVQTGHASILNLKGASPDIQGIAVARLAQTLFDARKAGQVPPFMFVVEEAHNYCPERGMSAAVSGPVLKAVASEGRKFGMGLLIVSQRPAKVDKNVLSQCNTQVIMKVTNPNDLKAIGASVEGITGETTDEVQRLGTGVALVAGGNLVTPALVEIRTRMTRHGGRSVNVLVHEEDVEVEFSVPATAAAEAPEPAPFEMFDLPLAVADDGPPAPEPEPSEPALPDLGAFFDATAPEPSSRAMVPRSSDTLTPGPWSADATDLRLPLVLEDQPPLVEGELAPPGPLGADDEERLSADQALVPTRRPGKLVEAVSEDYGPDEVDAPVIGPSIETLDNLVFRVVERLGFSQAHNPREAVARVHQAAHNIPNLTADEYVERFAEVGRIYCHPAMPDCGPCPLLDGCRLGQERLARREVRKGRWGSKAR